MNNFIDSRYRDGRIDGRATYRAWQRTYSAAESLLDYVWERWRSDPYFYNHSTMPTLSDKFALVMGNV